MLPKEKTHIDFGELVFIVVILLLLTWGFFICGGTCAGLIIMGAVSAMPVALLIGGVYWVFRRKQCLRVIFKSYRMLLFIVCMISILQIYATRALQASFRPTDSTHYENH